MRAPGKASRGQAEGKKKGKMLRIKAWGCAAMVQPWRGDRMVWHGGVRPPVVPAQAEREREREREAKRLVRSSALCRRTWSRVVGPAGTPVRELREGINGWGFDRRMVNSPFCLGENHARPLDLDRWLGSAGHRQATFRSRRGAEPS